MEHRPQGPQARSAPGLNKDGKWTGCNRPRRSPAPHLFHPNPASRGHPGWSPPPHPVTSTSLAAPPPLTFSRTLFRSKRLARSPPLLPVLSSVSLVGNLGHTAWGKVHSERTLNNRSQEPQSAVTGGIAGCPIPQARPKPRPPLLTSIPFTRDSLAWVHAQGDGTPGSESNPGSVSSRPCDPGQVT